MITALCVIAALGAGEPSVEIVCEARPVVRLMSTEEAHVRRPGDVGTVGGRVVRGVSR